MFPIFSHLDDCVVYEHREGVSGSFFREVVCNLCFKRVSFFQLRGLGTTLETLGCEFDYVTVNYA